MLDHVEQQIGGGQPEAAVLWLHGLGADGNDFMPIVPILGMQSPSTRFVFPHAPTRPVTVNQGMRMRAWYDIKGFDLSQREDAVGIAESAQAIDAWLDALIDSGIPSERIVLAGFSQGGAMALHVGLRRQQRLAGIMALSCYLPLADAAEAERSAANASTPILMCHGEQDPVVPCALGEQSATWLRQHDYSLQWQTWPMAHEVCPPQIQAIGQWLSTTLQQHASA